METTGVDDWVSMGTGDCSVRCAVESDYLMSNAIPSNTSGIERAQGEVLCPACQYSLRGIESDRCPECGTHIDRALLFAGQIPWIYRGVIGSLPAYWRTVWLVVCSPAKVANVIHRPVSYRDARLFQHATVLLASIPAMAFVNCGLSETELFHVRAFSAHPLGWLLELGLLPVICFALWLFLLTATGAPAYFFHPRSIPVEQQNRAIALSYYASAPLALTPILAALIGCFIFLKAPAHAHAKTPADAYAVATVGALLLILIVISLWRGPLIFLARTTNCSAIRLWGLALYLPCSWAVLACLILGGIPAAYVFVSMFILSLP